MKKLSSVVLGISLLASSALFANTSSSLENKTVQAEQTFAWLFPDTLNNN